VLPVDADFDLVPDDPYWYLKGDGYLQRQVEPTIGASTLNPDHMLAFFNDYRAVDVVEGDVGLGEGELTTVALKAAKLLLPPSLSSTIPRLELIPPISGAEAWIGGSRSYDGGYTWSGFFLPGAPPELYDNEFPLGEGVTLPDVSTNAPIFGMEAATDPVLACGPCGTFYLAFVAFTRGGESKIAVARYRDTNAIEGGDTIQYEGMTVIESGNNAEFGYFLDKPDIEVDAFRVSTAAKAKPVDPEPADPCGHRVYVTYSTFNGLTKDSKVQTKMNFAVSEDGGETFATQKINKNFGQNQGSAIAVDPRPGLPGEGGGGTVYVLWRHFFDPDAMIWTKTSNYGGSWSNPAILTDDTPLVPFDQPTISITAAPILPGALNPGLPEVAFRSNGFPTAAATANGKVFAAWQERVGPAGTPLENGTPRIVAMRYDPDTGDWSGFNPTAMNAPDGQRQVVDYFPRDEPFDPLVPIPPGGPPHSNKHARFAGPQVEPKLSFGGGRLMLNYYESRGRIANYGTANEQIESDPLLVDYTPFITGYDRVMDFRTTLLDPTNGEYISSGQISRYPLRIGADLTDGQDLSDVAPVNAPCYPDSGVFGVDPICSRQVNRVNAPTSALGTSPWIGDYVDTVPYVQFVPDGDGGWRWATEPTDVPSQGFHGIWTDNRHLIPPTEVDETATYAVYRDEFANPATGENIEEWEKYQSYGPPGIGGACYNPGSRNTDVLTSRIDTDVIVNTPTTVKRLTQDRNFPFSISNKTGEFKRFQVNLTSPASIPVSDNGNDYFITVSLSPKEITNENPAQTTYDIVVFPYSSGSLTVFVNVPEGTGLDFTNDVEQITLEVLLDATAADAEAYENEDWTLCGPPACLVGTVSFNSYVSEENLAGDPEDFGPTVENAFVINWDIENIGDPNAFVINNFLDNAFVINTADPNAFVINGGVDNAFVINAFVINAFVINSTIHEVTDTVWTMTPGSSNTSASYVPLPNIDNAEELIGKYAFQLIVDKPAGYAGIDVCDIYNVEQQQILANVVQNPADPNAFVINDSIENAFVINNQVDNAFVINSAFAIAPADGPAKSNLIASKEGVIDDSTKNVAAPNEVRVTLRAFQLVPDDQLPIDPFTGTIIEYNPGEHPATMAMFHQGCDHTITDPKDSDFCVAQIGADLIVDSLSLTGGPIYEYPYVGYKPVGDLEPPELPSVGQCGTFSFPEFTLSNIGNADLIPRSGTLHHAVFLSQNATLDLGSDLLLTEPPDRDIDSDPLNLVAVEPDSDPNTDTLGPVEITLPAQVEPGHYYSILFADYPREASEYDETNNTAVLRLEVTEYSGVSYDFAGVTSPLDGTVYTANAGSVIPLNWQYTFNGEVVASDWTDPEIRIRPVECGTNNEIQYIEVVLDPGSSDYRYKPGSDTHTLNWQTKDLEPGCYNVRVFNPSICQEVGPFPVVLE
jgi:hypothetical protein